MSCSGHRFFLHCIHGVEFGTQRQYAEHAAVCGRFVRCVGGELLQNLRVAGDAVVQWVGVIAALVDIRLAICQRLHATAPADTSQAA